MALTFDANYYLSARPDVFNAFVKANGSTGLTWAQFAENHYNTFGRFEGSNPNSVFNTTEYLTANPDVAAAGVNPFQHFLTFGVNEGRSPNASFPTFASFDSATYLSSNPDLAAAGITTKAQAWAHFVVYGEFEGRPGAPVVDNGIAGSTFTLTTGVDTFTGTGDGDVFNASLTDGATPTPTLGGLDSIDGGAGRDTLNADFGSQVASLSTASIKSIEVMNVATTASANLDVTGIVGLETLNVVNGSNAGATVTKGGEIVAVTGGGAASVSGSALESVTLSKVGVNSTGYAAGVTGPTSQIVVNNTVASGANTGTTLTSVTLDNIRDVAGTAVPGGVIASLNGNAINDVTVKNQSVNLAATITNSVSKSLEVNVDNAGYSAAGTAVAGVVVNAGSAAEAITVDATGGKSNVTVNAAAAKTLTITGTADLVLAGVAGAALKSIDGSTATGGITLGTLNVGTADVKTGAGADKFQISATKVVVDAGAGNDTVTLGSTIAVGSTINLGAGDDIVLSSSGAVSANTTAASTVVEGGEGTDSVAASLINAVNAKQFVNFERIDASTGGTTLDVNLMTGSTIGGVTLNGGAGTTTLQNLAAGAGLTVSGANTGSLTIGVAGAAANAADTFGITFAGQAASTATAASPTNVSADEIALQGVETVNVASAGTGFVSNALTLEQNTELKAVTITGDKDLSFSLSGVTGGDATFGGTGTGKGISSIDGSTATGKLNIDLGGTVTAATGGDDVIVNLASAGLTIKGGSAADTIEVGQFSSTLTGGAGNDKFIVAEAAVQTGATTAAAALKTTITDFAAGDTIDFTAATTGTSTTVTKIDLTASVQTLDDALALVPATDESVSWFNYGSDTYVVYNADASTGLDATDVLVKLVGSYDLSNGTVDAGAVFGLA